MIVGIVGAEGAKFTPETQAKAREAIRQLLLEVDPNEVVSGACHLGGIDIWAVEEATKLDIITVEHKPARLTWEGGYKQRNLKIAQNADLVVSVVVKTLPPSFKSKWVFPQGCYHCKTPPEHHIKSGGCWTMKQAGRMGKETRLVVIE